jgi:acyl-CoA synthetase (AMP-forming)/AMP-acid ligase II
MRTIRPARPRPTFQILGRASVDIIKSNAFKVSALEVEGAVLQHPEVQVRGCMASRCSMHALSVPRLHARLSLSFSLPFMNLDHGRPPCMRATNPHAIRQECAVLGVPDELHGEVITALVVLKDGAAARLAGDAPAALRAFCGEKLPKYKAGVGFVLGVLRVDARRPLIHKLVWCEVPPLFARLHFTRQIPGAWRLLDQPLPRNAMGKINKKELLKRFFA